LVLLRKRFIFCLGKRFIAAGGSGLFSTVLKGLFWLRQGLLLSGAAVYFSIALKGLFWLRQGLVSAFGYKTFGRHFAFILPHCFGRLY